ncbi:Retrovirus-related Pol polyprotein from transposon [Smittium culicis]|uniref:Retrovirus-related Pol polyprotein from transposon n=1 Tax=Smittium culicis TaxID=133412 RepID=A0A1R1YGT7_9FUNG|nr:Retrovirus-related Pol polyprotein from transposon [Smittium culicis]
MTSQLAPECADIHQKKPEYSGSTSKELYEAGYARPSTSHYSANPLIVPKADGTPRVVINFSPLNIITIRDEYPLPRIDVMLNQLFGCCFYSKFDVLKAFYQIPLHPDSVEASAFSNPDGHHEFLVMPQGMSNSPATFQRNIDRTLRECIDGDYCAAFADDILVFSKTREEHLVHLRSVLKKLSDKGFKLNPKKCIFAVPKVDILGFTVSKDGQEIAEDKIAAVKKFPRPINVPTLRRFLGMTSFCRAFIENFTDTAAPLYKKLKNDTYDWNSECETAFQSLKMAMTSEPVLAHPDTSMPYIMKLFTAEVNYCVSDKEALVVVYGFNKFHHYVHGSCTELHTDHRALITALKNEDPRGRIARWNSALQAYDFTVKHVKGLDNTLTDALSRDFEDNDTDDCKIHLPITRSRNIGPRTRRIWGQLDELIEDDFPLNTADSAQSDYYDATDPDFNRSINPIPRTTTAAENDTDQTLQECNLTEYLPSRADFTKMQQIDPKINEILITLNSIESSSTLLAKQAESYCIKNSMLHNVSNPECPRLYVPAALNKAVIYHHHDTPMMSLLGHRRTLDKIKQTFFWPKMSRDVFGYINLAEYAS